MEDLLVEVGRDGISVGTLIAIVVMYFKNKGIRDKQTEKDYKKAQDAAVDSALRERESQHTNDELATLRKDHEALEKETRINYKTLTEKIELLPEKIIKRLNERKK